MKWFLSRMREPTTWLGLCSLIPSIITAAAGPITAPVIGGIVGGVAGVLMKEKGAQ